MIRYEKPLIRDWFSLKRREARDRSRNTSHVKLVIQSRYLSCHYLPIIVLNIQLLVP